MDKYKGFLLTLILVLGGGNYAIAGYKNTADLKITEVKQPPRRNIPGGSRMTADWENLYQRKPPPREDVPGGSRGEVEVCAIAPATHGNMRAIWSDRPLFLWRGTIGKIELRHRESQQVLWSYNPGESDTETLYQGEALKPGETYRLVLFDRGNEVMFSMSFQVLGKEQRDRITNDLNNIETQLKQKNATPDEIAYAKADYFATHQMWADVLQVAYSVQNPSPGLSKFKQSIPDWFCPSKNS